MSFRFIALHNDSRWRIRTVNWFNSVWDYWFELLIIWLILKVVLDSSQTHKCTWNASHVWMHGHGNKMLCFYVTILGHDRIDSEGISIEESKSLKQLSSLKTLTRVYAQGFRNSSTTRSHDSINSSDPVTVPSIISRRNWNSLGDESSR